MRKFGLNTDPYNVYCALAGFTSTATRMADGTSSRKSVSRFATSS